MELVAELVARVGSQRKLAAMCGVSYTTIQHVAKGERSPAPRLLATLETLADELERQDQEARDQEVARVHAESAREARVAQRAREWKERRDRELREAQERAQREREEWLALPVYTRYVRTLVTKVRENPPDPELVILGGAVATVAAGIAGFAFYVSSLVSF